jgi:N12 class adenine-specific DNA methylase
MNPAIKLRQIQKDVIWRGLQSKSLMIAHQVGFGKTYSQIGIGMRLKQMGLRRRVGIVVKRATFGQFVAAIRDAYPLAYIAPIASGQSPQQRRRHGPHRHRGFELIITTHPVFTKISVPGPSTLFARADGRDRAAIWRSRVTASRKTEKAKKRLENKLKTAMDSGITRSQWAVLGRPGHRCAPGR